MVDKIKELWGKVLEWWNKFTAKQKTMIIGVAAAVIFAFAILIWVFSQPTYVELHQCETTKEASEIVNLLEGADIEYKTSTDGLQIQVKAEDKAPASLALGAAGIPATSMTIDDVTNGGFSTTESDKQKRYVALKQSELENIIESMEAVKMARVQLSVPKEDGTLIATTQETSATVFLELAGDFSEENAASVARAVATSLGNATTNCITILDMTTSQLLFSGANEISAGGLASSQLSARQQQETRVINSIKRVLLGTGQFNSVEVACNLDIDFSSSTSQSQTYDAPAGRTEGMLDEETVYSAESTGNNGGLPGTDSNENDNNTTYQFPDYSNSSSTETEEHRKYLPNSYTESSETPPGKVNFANSSATITAVNYRVIKEEDAKEQGLLEGISWDEYKAANSEPVKLAVDEEFYSAAATATGMNVENITIMAFSRNEFIDRDSNIRVTDVVSILLIILILLLLGLVVLRSMKSKKEPEPEEELSVETLLQSTPESELEDIGLENKSETRMMIEKFVDENPEAAANLLRNWLNEDWG